jgi:hypothetical protein
VCSCSVHMAHLYPSSSSSTSSIKPNNNNHGNQGANPLRMYYINCLAVLVFFSGLYFVWEFWGCRNHSQSYHSHGPTLSLAFFWFNTRIAFLYSLSLSRLTINIYSFLNHSIKINSPPFHIAPRCNNKFTISSRSFSWFSWFAKLKAVFPFLIDIHYCNYLFYI